MRRFAALLGSALALAGLCAAQASASDLRLTPASGAQFPGRAFLLTLNSRATVSPRQISVSEGGSSVSALSVEPASTIGESHFGTVLLVDTSESMAGAAEQSAIQAMRTFVATRNPKQPVGIVFFDQTPRVVVPMTTDNATLDHALATTPQLHVGTHIFDAVSAALNMLAGANLTGGSIVLASDGRDTGSQTSEQAVAGDAGSQGVRFYTVGVQDPSFDGTTLNSLASTTGGVYTPANSSTLVSLYRQLGVALSNQYVIRYESRSRLGSRVTVTVAVAGHGTASTVYTAPSLAPALPSGPAGTFGGSSSFWTSSTAAVLISIVCAMLFGLAVLAIVGRRAGVRSRVSPFVGLLSQPLVEDRPRSLVQRALGEPGGRKMPRSGWTTRLGEDIDVARLQISASRLIVLGAVLTGVFAFGVLSLEGPVALLLVPLVPFGIRFAISTKASRQRRAFGEQLPDNLSVVASALRAGNTFVGSLGVVTNDAPEPSKRELRRALADEQLGVPLVDALNKISERMQSTDFRHVALVATLQAETGGNTAEVLDVVTETIRERLELRRLVRTLTAQGRLSGWVLSALPAFLLLALSVINPSYTSPLFHKTIGIIGLVFAAILVTMGAMVIRKIVDIDV